MSSKVGIIRCEQTQDMCPGTTDFKFAREGAGAFASGPAEIVGFVTCGGCPGKRAVSRAKMMVQRGAQAIHFASCVAKGSPIGFPCPHFAAMKEAVQRAVGPEIPVIDFTH